MIINNPSNNCVYTQPANNLPFAFQQKPQGLTQTNTVSFIRPPFPMNSVQPNPYDKPPTEQNIQCGPPVSTIPRFFHPPTAPYSITPIAMMDVWQTGIWIWTLGYFKGWKEAETYSKNFKENSISGKSLQQLTSQMLESDLGVIDETHQRELLSTIRSLYPQSTGVADSFCSVQQSMNTTLTKTFESTFEVANDGSPSRTRGTSGSILKYLVPSDEEDSCTESGSFYRRSTTSSWSADEGCSVQDDFTPTLDSDYTTLDAGAVVSYCPKQQQSYAEVLVRPSGGSSKPKLTTRKSKSGEHTKKKEEVMKKLKKTSSICRTGKTVYKKLILSLRPSQMWQDKAVIRQRLRDFNLTVTRIEEEEAVDTIYTLVFPNCEMAENAFLHAKDLDYELKRKYPKRPNPKRPIEYISLGELVIREGKAFSGKVVGVLPAHEIVTVNQVKGRRARLIDVIDGNVTNRGWVSIHSAEGKPLLAQVSEL